MTNCEFKTNKAPSGHGSALAFNIRYDIELSGCIFEGNEATQGGVICIRSMPNNNAKLLSEPSQTFSITDCQFTRKTLPQRSCLYFSNEAIDGETPSYNDIELEITSTNFNDNGGSQQFYFVSPCGKLLFDNNTITYSDKLTSTPTLELTYLSEKATIKIEQVDANGYIKLIGCTFDDCHGQKAGCFDINSKTSNLELKNNTIKNMKPTNDGNCYSISIQTESGITIVFDGWTLNDNSCDGLYGGGTGGLKAQQKQNLLNAFIVITLQGNQIST